MKQRTERGQAIRQVLEDHVARRRASALAKWEGKTDSTAKNKIADINDKYHLDLLISKGVAGSSQIAVATHVAKATHPDLSVKQVTNLNILPTQLPSRTEIGSHLLSTHHSWADTTGNGAYVTAAYELYLLLDQPFEGRSIGSWLQDADEDAVCAVAPASTTPEAAATLAANCVALLDSKTKRPSSHSLAKQLYWSVSGEPNDDSGYHLLQPLFASSLAHAVHQQINDARFGESNNQASQAKRDKKNHDDTYRDYRNLVVRKLGGTKPQNISQLNSERGGVNYLLASLPPSWQHNRPRHLLLIDSTLPRFARFEGVPELLDALLTLLKSAPPATMETRKKRERIEQALGESLVAFGATLHAQLQPGWTRDSDCHLPEYEKLWLDPERATLPPRESHAEEDQAFTAAYEWMDWPNQVAHAFGNWLNAILRSNDLPVGDVEHAHWARQALIDAQWPAPIQRRRVLSASLDPEVQHG